MTLLIYVLAGLVVSLATAAFVTNVLAVNYDSHLKDSRLEIEKKKRQYR